jgi:methyl-accepting chemotaxis protein
VAFRALEVSNVFKVRFVRFGLVRFLDENFKALFRRIEQMANDLETTVTALRASVDSLKTESVAALSRVSEDVTELIRQIAAGSTPTETITALEGIGADVDSVVASLKATDPVADFPAPPAEPTI